MKKFKKNKLCYNEESFNNYLKKLFYKKPSLYELIYHLKREESLSYNNYKRKIEGESELIDKKCDKNDIIDLCVCACGLLHPTSPNLVFDAETVSHGSTLCGHPDKPAIKFG
ncbi:hypothetical protein H8356DRAFT_1327565 [Neocallimastix lanati (nom. inval.)]|nr:hypothetical protein H8356DRAFT_1327565 [Neocallimastix sp. JGI-2020a]